MEISEKCTKRPAHRLPGIRAPIPGMALNIAGDVLLADPAKVAGASRAHFTQELANYRQIADNRRRRQTAFLIQIIAELLENLVMRSKRR